MKYRTVQTMMLTDFIIKVREEFRYSRVKKNHYPYRKMRKQICLRILTGFTRNSGRSMHSWTDCG